MKRIQWGEDEAVALYNLYFKYGETGTAPAEELECLTNACIKRANLLELNPDSKFRNRAGLSMQLACIHYVVTGGDAGLSSASKLFYETYNLYKDNRAAYDAILIQFTADYM